MKTKSNERTRVMRGQTYRQEWAIVYQDSGKRWREYASGRAVLMVLGFASFVDYNKRKNWNTRTGTSPVRLLAPGGIIVGEHSVKPRTKLRDTGKLRPSITVDPRALVPGSSIIAPPVSLKSSPVLAKSYLFLTIRKHRG